MKKVLFVCLGNICRSPMAEFIFKDMIKKRNLENSFLIESRATCMDEVGNDMYYLAKEILDKHNISYEPRKAKQIDLDDYNNFDYIIAMEEKNITNIKRILGLSTNEKIYRLLDFSKNKRDISDPWYTRDFEKAYNDIDEGLNDFISFLGY